MNVTDGLHVTMTHRFFRPTTPLGIALNELRVQNQLCDVVINVGGRAFPAHKAVLAVRSSYFVAMFTSGFKESTQDDINITDGAADVFEILLHSAYTGRMEISLDATFDVFEMACYMQFPDVVRYCIDFFKQEYYHHREGLSIRDVFKLARLAHCHDYDHVLKEIAQDAMGFLFHNLSDLKAEEEFVHSPNVDFLEAFLKCQHLLSDTDGEKEVCVLNSKRVKADY